MRATAGVKVVKMFKMWSVRKAAICVDVEQSGDQTRNVRLVDEPG